MVWARQLYVTSGCSLSDPSAKVKFLATEAPRDVGGLLQDDERQRFANSFRLHESSPERCGRTARRFILV